MVIIIITHYNYVKKVTKMIAQMVTTICARRRTYLAVEAL